jgi:hypothetical protein
MKQFVRRNVREYGTLIETLTIFDDCTYCPSLNNCFNGIYFEKKAKDCPCGTCIVKAMCNTSCGDKKTHDLSPDDSRLK